MTRLSAVFLSFTKTDSNCYVGSRTKTRHGLKAIRTVRFQLEKGGFLVIEHMLYVLELNVNLLSVSTFEDGGYGITFQ